MFRQLPVLHLEPTTRMAVYVITCCDQLIYRQSKSGISYVVCTNEDIAVARNVIQLVKLTSKLTFCYLYGLVLQCQTDIWTTIALPARGVIIPFCCSGYCDTQESLKEPDYITVMRANVQ